MKTFNTGWYVIYTRPRHEKKVHAFLNEYKIGSFLPTRKILRSWHDRKRFIDEPLFPSYVFIYLTDIENYYKGIEVDGALYYVKNGKEIAKVSESVINNIKLVTNQQIEVSEDRFQPGRQLMIKKGALTGLSCEVVQVNSKQKLLVRVDLLQRNLLLTLPEDYFLAL